ncbi:MAG TPA: M13 family metallopeptidase, partial [Steroidobacteraceae bacterium]|nr:M13 family metallopeptidase [Steroidobacteraceae bacterium]
MKRLLLCALALCGGVALGDTHAPDLSGMDTSVAPGDDFFAYANGAWIKTTEIPADRAGYGNSAILSDLTTQRVNELLKAAAAQPGRAGTEAQQISDYYSSYMDETAIEARGAKPLTAALERIDQIFSRSELAAALGETMRADVDVLNSTNLYTPHLFGLWVAQDLNDPKRYSPFLLQGGLGLPDREYYLSNSQAMAAIRPKYQAHIASVLGLAGIDRPADRAAKIFELERRMAEVHWTRAASEQISAGNNHWARSQFDAKAPDLDWRAFFAAAGLGGQNDFVIWQPSALIGLARLTATESLDTWKDYLKFHAIADAAPYLSKAFVEESFAFNGHVLFGIPELKPRWKRAVAVCDTALGDAVGKLYVQKYFSPAEKKRAEAMVRNLLAAFDARIDKLDWMAPQTKAVAKNKLKALKIGVGYPDHWRSYAGMRVVRGDAFGNWSRAEEFEYKRNLAKLGQDVDRSEWVMNAQLVNAVNLPAMNAINFPAAVLQPPYFDPKQPLSMDYGAIGATIGHEISHSFDDQGALFDAQGRLKNWWQPNDFAHFRASGARLAAQFDAYKPFPDLSLNGTQTLSENIADVAGLNAAYDAYRLATKDAPPVKLSGFDNDQLFFLSYAQSWREKNRDAALRDQVITDGHAPAQYRTYTVRNLDGWYDAFQVKAGQTLYLAPNER